MHKEEHVYDLNGKVALVTGAGGKLGLGRAIALCLAEEGADVVVNDVVPRRTGSPGWAGLPDVVREIEALGRRASAIVADVSDGRQVEEMVQKVLQQFGRIDVLVNNAGAPAGQDRVPVIELEEEPWDLVQRVNVRGTFLCCKAVARAMVAQGQGGKIINMSSIAGKQGMPRFAAYSASKFAVVGFTQALALELAAYHINVNAICPSLIATERVDDMAAALAPEGTSVEAYRMQMLADATGANPMGRMGQPVDVAQLAAFLASDQSNFLTGLSIPVAGGSCMA
jgi:NAD(P)-dependent dehydrogenase (short-subunit alcohol dehydrogenase family)